MNREKRPAFLLRAGALLISCLWLAISGEALAITDGQEDPGYTPATAMNVDVGYYGMEHYAKGNYSLETMEALGGSGREIYTFIDRNRRPVTGEAEGIWLGPFLDAIGVDRAAVSRYHFYSSDNYMGEAGMEVTERRLFEIPRFSFSDTVITHAVDERCTITNFDYDNGAWSDEVWKSAREVQVMLAIRSSFNKWPNSDGWWPSNLDYAGLSDAAAGEHCLRLMFGEPDTSTKEAYLSCYLIHALVVDYEGYPDLIAESEMSGDVGSSQEITIAVQTPENELSVNIGNDLTFGSSDESVATFTQSSAAVEGADGSVTVTGTVTYTGEGTVELFASYNGDPSGNSAARISASGQAGTGDKQTGGTGTGTGTGDGSGSGSGTGSGSGSDTGTGAGEGARETSAANTGTSATIYLADGLGTALGGGGSNAGTTSADSERTDVDPEINPETTDMSKSDWSLKEVKDPTVTDNKTSDSSESSMGNFMILFAAVFFAGGFLERALRFRKDIKS